ncbi:hypothetical protein OEZ85_006330 [Tetradesmus obliquus]|uniref:Cilia- and flagella-associated protein 69 ARM repeats domain-containing protein n=1 Tax=Tetradesmus obliquus TaxID=3088 RepID=A0ABY8TU76_TETOB|nr:hypothetical protein OEZ85_006330 [Tetradesmus obliquus]
MASNSGQEGKLMNRAKERRNDVLAVLQHLSSLPCCCAAFATASFLPTALAAATTPELQPSSQLVPPSAITSEDADHEMKLLLWGILGNAAAGSGGCLAAVAPALLRALLLVVDESAVHGCFAVGRWNPEQLLAMRKSTWSVLQQLAPLCKPDFCSCGGAKVLVRHISSCYSSNCSAEWAPRSCSSPGGRSQAGGGIAALAATSSPSFQATGFVSGGGGTFSGRLSSSSIEPALRLLQRLVAGDAAMAEALAEQGLVGALLQLLQAPVCGDAGAARQGLLLVLAEMCEAGGRGVTSKVRQADGVGLLLKECQDVLDSDATQPSLAGLAALGALWRCVLPSGRSRAQLLALDGMDVLLALLQRGNQYLRPVTLSVLADLLADKRSHPFFLEWHAPATSSNTAAGPDSTSSTSLLSAARLSAGSAGLAGSLGAPQPPKVNAAQLLIGIWREQDQARGLSGPDGLLANPSRPLAGSGERTKWAVGEVGVAGGYGVLQSGRKAVLQRIAQASCPDLLMDKVYACFAQLDLAGLSSRLAPADAAALAFIRQYLKFRQGEVWQGIAADFEAAGLSPTQEDKLRVVSGIQHSELIAHQVRSEQAALLSAVRQQQLAAEQAGYDAMLAQAAADAQSKIWQKDSVKLTMRERLAAKERKEDMLAHSITSSISAAVAAAPDREKAEL